MSRYTIDFADDFDLLLSEMAKDESTTKSELIRRSLAYYNFIKNEILKEPGLKMSITDQNDTVIKDIVVPYWNFVEKSKETPNRRQGRTSSVAK